MKRLFTGLFVILLLLVGAVAFFRVAPQLAPEPVKPALGWVRQTQDHYTGEFIAWRNQLLGITNLVKDARQAPGAVLSDSATRGGLPQVAIDRVEVAQVNLDQDGTAPGRFEVGRSIPAESPPSSVTTTQAMADDRPVADQTAVSVAPAVKSTEQPAINGQSSPASVRAEQPERNSRMAVDSNRALAVLADTDDVLAKADAAIAAADAALARAQQREDEKATKTDVAKPPVAQAPVQAPLVAAADPGVAPAPEATGSPEVSPTIEPGSSTQADAPAAGSVAGGAAIVLSQNLMPAPAVAANPDPIIVARAGPSDATPAQPAARTGASSPGSKQQASEPPVFRPLPAREPVALKTREQDNAKLAMARPAQPRIPVPEVIPPDAPPPPEPVTQGGRKQQASIQNFLAGQVVEFQTGRDVLTRQGRRALNKLLDMIQANQNTIITIQGHTDNVGDESSNLELSSARSIRARAYLIARGVDPQRLRVQGFGELRPIASNRTVQGRIRNRRIDFAVSDRIR